MTREKNNIENNLKRRIENLTREKNKNENNLNKRIEDLEKEKIIKENNLNRRIRDLEKEKIIIENNLNRRIEELKEEKDNIENNLNKRIEDLKKENNIIKKNFTLDITELKEKIKILATDINSKYQEINYYKSELKKKNEEKTNIPLIKPEETIFSVLFLSQGFNDVNNYAMTVKNTDIFYSLEEKLFNDFPQLKELKLIYMVNVRNISRSKTLEENNIKHNDIINVFINNFEE